MSSITYQETADRPADWPADGEMHFRLVDQLLGPLDLDCDKGYVVRSYDFSHPEIRAVTYANSLDDGLLDLTKFVGQRAVNLDLTLKARASPNDTGPLIAPEPVLRDRLRAYLHPARRPRLIFSEHQDSRVRQVLLRGAESGVPFTMPRYNAMSVSWVAPRGYVESYMVRSVYATLDGTLGDTLEIDIVNDGTAPAYWAVRIEGEMVHPRFGIINPVYGSRFLQLDYDIRQAGDVVTVDSYTKTVNINGAPIGFRYVNDQSDWFRIPPGESRFVLDSLDPIRKGYEYGTWTTGSHQLPGVPAASDGQWSDRASTLPLPSPPLAPAGPPFAWSSRPDPEAPGSTPSTTSLQFSWIDTWI